MGEEVLDLAEHDRRQIALFLNIGIVGEGGVVGNADQLLVAAVLVFQVQHRDRANAHDRAGHEGRAGNDQRVKRIAVGRKRVRHETVVGG